MSEPDISNLARNLAEQNNVDWRKLIGSGPDGRVVERDVLDYLARVMAGEEATDPTPEPLPEGMEAWPDQDAPSYFTGGALATDADNEPEDAEAASDMVEDPLTAAMQAAESELLAVESTQHGAADLAASELEQQDEPASDPWSQSPVDLTEPAPYAAGSSDDDDDLSADIFLFDDDSDDLTSAGVGGSADSDLFQDAPSDVGTSYGFGGSGTDDDAGDDLSQVESTGGWSGGDLIEDADEALLVADDDVDAIGQDDLGGAEPDAAVDFSTGGSSADEAFESQAEYAIESEVLGTELGSYDQDFVTPGEHVSSGADDWSSVEPGSDAAAGTFEDGASAASDELPDLWEGDEDGDAEEVLSFTDAPAAPFNLADVDADDAGSDALAEQDDERYTAYDQGQDVDDIQDLEQAEALDELDAVSDLSELDGDAGAEPLAEVSAAAVSAAAVSEDVAASLPLARTGTMLRRHVDISALASAQLAVGQELGLSEPIGVAAFLVRAAARAVSELGGINGQVALAEFEGELSFRRVDDASTRGFSDLVNELMSNGSEEDELGLAVVDLSGYDLDEVVLNIEVPTLTLGRVLYDTQRGTHRSTLTLSGDLPFGQGAKLLARVADLLDAPVRLFV